MMDGIPKREEVSEALEPERRDLGGGVGTSRPPSAPRGMWSEGPKRVGVMLGLRWGVQVMEGVKRFEGLESKVQISLTRSGLVPLELQRVFH